jgi:hypothetical protein
VYTGKKENKMTTLDTKKEDDLSYIDYTPMNFINLFDPVDPVQSTTYSLGGDPGSTLTGTFGIDTATFAALARADVTMTKLDDIAAKDGTVTTDRWQADYIPSSDSKDGSTSDSKTGGSIQSSLTGIERVQFTDTSLALDLDVSQNAGSALALLYAGFDALPDADTFGKWIAQADNIDTANGSKAGAEKDTQDMAELGQSMIDFYVPNGVSNEDLVTLMYHNILGVVPTEQQLDIVSVIEDGSYTQGGYLALAAGLDINTVQYTGIQSKGLAYTPEDSKLG